MHFKKEHQKENNEKVIDLLDILIEIMSESINCL